jgi:surfeit locus 1 family protein
MPHLRFQFRPIPTLATLALLLLFVYLGLWQSGKAQRRAAELAQHAARAQQGALPLGATLVDAESLRDAPITVKGRFDAKRQFFVDNRQEDGKPGVHVVTPLKIEGSETWILVNRGWVGWGNSRQTLPQVSVPEGVVQVSGVAAVPSSKKFFLMPEHAEADPQLWSRLDIQRFASQAAVVVQPIVLLQATGDSADALVRHWPPPEDRVAMHQGYAFQWFGMACALLVFYFVSSVRKEANHE